MTRSPIPSARWLRALGGRSSFHPGTGLGTPQLEETIPLADRQTRAIGKLDCAGPCTLLFAQLILNRRPLTITLVGRPDGDCCRIQCSIDGRCSGDLHSVGPFGHTSNTCRVADSACRKISASFRLGFEDFTVTFERCVHCRASRRRMLNLQSGKVVRSDYTEKLSRCPPCWRYGSAMGCVGDTVR
jgi:hypothetical protein